jgi:3-oxoacyl-[acyl-carrier-protein] synthase III
VKNIRSIVRGVGGYLPARVLTNAELAKKVDTSDEWIVQRTGIRERHVAADGEMTSWARGSEESPHERWYRR